MVLEFADGFTLDGRIKPRLGVSKAKVAAVKRLTESTMNGDRAAKGLLEESISSSDAIFNLAHLFAINITPQIIEAPRVWSQLATTRTVSDFRAPTLYTLNPEWEANGVLGSGTPRHVAPRIPEGTAYPYATMSGEESNQGGIQKRGFKTGFTFEAFINDAVGFLQALPEAMRQVALDTEEYEVFNGLISNLGDDEQLKGGVIPGWPETQTVAPNAAFSREALIRAIIEVTNREINGRKVVLTGGFNLLIPAGQRMFVDYVLNNVTQTGVNVTSDGVEQTFTINGYNPLSGITVIETEYVTGQSWYLVPKNTGGRPLLQLLRLAGHELPELRVENATGSYVGGGAVSPFEGSFDNDASDFRLRTIGHGVLWYPSLVIWSDGSGVA